MVDVDEIHQLKRRGNYEEVKRLLNIHYDEIKKAKKDAANEFIKDHWRRMQEQGLCLCGRPHVWDSIRFCERCRELRRERKMPLLIKEVEETPEEYLYGGRDNLPQRIHMFLIRNKGMAYTTTEMRDGFLKTVDKQRLTIYDIKKALQKLLEKEKPIKRKGSYYWIEEEK